MTKGAFRLPAWWRRFVLVMPFTLFLLYAVAAVSFAAVAFDAAPARVLALYPANAPALSTLARDSLLEADGPRSSRRHALQSLRQGPVEPQNNAAPDSPFPFRCVFWNRESRRIQAGRASGREP